LPAPVVAGSTATYRDALGAGIALVMSATVSGDFSDTLVIANHQAATNPALASIRLPITATGGAQRRGGAGDGVLVTGPGKLVLESGTPLMWDSNTTSPAATPG